MDKMHFIIIITTRRTTYLIFGTKNGLYRFRKKNDRKLYHMESALTKSSCHILHNIFEKYAKYMLYKVKLNEIYF